MPLPASDAYRSAEPSGLLLMSALSPRHSSTRHTARYRGRGRITANRRPLVDLRQRHCGASTAGEPPVAASTDEPLALTRWGVQPRSRSQFRHGYVCSFADGPVRDRTDSRGKKITGQRKNGLSKPRLQMTSVEFISLNGKRSKPLRTEPVIFAHLLLVLRNRPLEPGRPGS